MIVNNQFLFQIILPKALFIIIVIMRRINSLKNKLIFKIVIVVTTILSLFIMLMFI